MITTIHLLYLEQFYFKLTFEGCVLRIESNKNEI